MNVTTAHRSGKYLLPLYTLTAVLILMTLGWWAGNQRAARSDADMRATLLRQVQVITRTINPDLARKLTFTAADKGTPPFEIIREQLTTSGKQIPSRGVFSMALRGSALFFGPENYPENDPLASPPGTLYKEPPAETVAVFRTKRPTAIGPYKDEFGTFVSAFAPVIDPNSGEVIMIVGLDILAEDWHAQVNAARREPLVIALVASLLFVGGAGAVRWHNRQRSTGDLKLKKWIIAPVTMAMLIWMVAFASYQNEQNGAAQRRLQSQLMEQGRMQLDQMIFGKVQMLRAQMDHLSRDKATVKAWQTRDLKALTALSQPFMERLKRQYDISHFYFITPARNCFLRVHQPERRGDVVSRYTLLTAERTGDDSWGIEPGSQGTFTLRYVRPTWQDGKVSGYLELGMEMNPLIKEMAANMGLDIVFLIHKESINKEHFSAEKKLSGDSGTRDEYPDLVVTSSTLPVLPEELALRFKSGRSSSTYDEMFRFCQGTRTFDGVTINLPDARGYMVAKLVYLRDVTATVGELRGSLFLNLGLTLTFLAGLLGMLWSVTRRAEKQLSDAFSQVKRSEEHLEDLVEERTAELETALVAANEANAAKNRFMANMSHELRTPLNAVLGFAGMLENDASLPSVSREKAKTIVKSGGHLLAIINDILEMARIEANRGELNNQPLDLHAFLDDLESMFQLLAKEKGISFIIDRTGDLPRHILADLGKLRQILFNLLGNAVKFTQFGSIVVRVMSIEGDRVEIEVKDTGIGISEEDMPKLFHPFEQINRGLASDTDGIGLGLAISREHARLMGGDITAECLIGKGCCFRFVFHAPSVSFVPTVKTLSPGGKTDESGGSAEAEQSLPSPTLDKMSAEWCQAFKEALVRKNITRIRKLGDDVKEVDPALSFWIVERAGRYDLDGLKELDNGDNRNSVKETQV